MSDDRLTAAEVRAIREGLGVTAEWLANHLGVQTRTVQRWESGQSAVKPFAVAAIRRLEAHAEEEVRRLTEAYLRDGSKHAVLFIEAGGVDSVQDAPMSGLRAMVEDGPSGWQRMIAFRVRQQIPGLRIIDTP
ncbi:helix-turn-helix domain-containing protein [Tsukamurella soli]|uniref:Helix-turn-helix domain-containing protein n=1 Tax=Tsukamurella soli TaxID=644556 RepID=A0ABP8JJI3_9ACTN